MIEMIPSILSGGVTGAVLVWLLRGWISERLKQSIQHEYSQKLATHKAELDTRIQAIQHENQLHQLHTSLFFDHQRNAFAGLLAKIAEVNQIWIDQEYDRDEGLTGPVPYEAYRDLRKTYYQHQLFLDTECLAAMELIFECYSDSFPVDDGSGAPPRRRDEGAAFRGIEYLQPRIAELFQQKIGVSHDARAAQEIALLGAIRLINRYHFAEIGLPVEGPLQVTYQDSPADAVVKAEKNIDDLVQKLKQFQAYLKEDGGFFHEAAMKLNLYLTMLDIDETNKQ
ncbi:MAG: hypothetical protein Q8N12_07395 [Thermodesulfovibrionales bacterium]|nr:hypothetical protein [Thermodesulfovibrionales bacterium]